MVKDVYCDQSLGSGNDDGTTWIHAYRLLTTAMNGFNSVAGDTLWVKNNNSTSGTAAFKGPGAFTNNPLRVFGVKAATSTSALPPVQSDLIPGLRTGSSTRAYDQTGGDAAPIFTTTVAGSDILLGGWADVYGLVFKAADNFTFNNSDSKIHVEECEVRAGHSESGELIMGANSTSVNVGAFYKSCKISAGTGGVLQNNNKGGILEFIDCVIDTPANPMMSPGAGQILFESCDFSAQSATLVDDGGGFDSRSHIWFHNTKINASSALVSGSITQSFRTEFIQTSSAAGKTTGQTFQEIDIITDNGNIVEETTRFRTGGADDGGSGKWSLAFTPNINATRDNREGMIGPRMAIEVVGDGTAQTLTVYIANSSASTDYQDDEVWLVAKSPSESGTADYDFYTTQMDLLATPANVTDDGSTWGSGANNSQKLQITLSPDYDGIIECWVVFAKNFGASPETLYVDPLPVLS